MKSNIYSPVMDLLDTMQIQYRILPHNSPTVSIEDTAHQRGVSPSQMVKTIVLRDMGGLLALACIPGDQQVDPKKVRALLQCRRMTCVSIDQVEEITGFTVGTINPVVIKTNMPIFLDHHFTSFEKVNISSGNRMAGLELLLSDLIILCKPTFASLCR